MKISLITTTKDRPDLLLECALSISSQTVLPHEWVVFIDDDFSKYKKTIDKIRTFLPKELLVMDCKPNTGRVGALIEAHKLATGTHFGLLDDDDWLDCRCIELCSAGVSDVIYTDFWEVRGKNARISPLNRRPYSYKAMFKSNIVFHFKLYSRWVYEKVGGYDNSFDTSMDYELSLRMLRHCTPEKINQPLYYYRIHDERISCKRKNRQRENARRAVEKHVDALQFL